MNVYGTDRWYRARQNPYPLAWLSYATKLDFHERVTTPQKTVSRLNHWLKSNLDVPNRLTIEDCVLYGICLDDKTIVPNDELLWQYADKWLRPIEESHCCSFSHNAIMRMRREVAQVDRYLTLTDVTLIYSEDGHRNPTYLRPGLIDDKVVWEYDESYREGYYRIIDTSPELVGATVEWWVRDPWDNRYTYNLFKDVGGSYMLAKSFYDREGNWTGSSRTDVDLPLSIRRSSPEIILNMILSGRPDIPIR